MAWHLSSSMLVLLRNTAMTTLDLIKWRVPLGNRFWSNVAFFSYNMAQSWKEMRSNRKAWRSVRLFGIPWLFSTLPFVSLPHLIQRKSRRWFWHVFETAHHFLLSTRLRPLTIEEKLSQLCQETVDSERNTWADRNRPSAAWCRPLPTDITGSLQKRMASCAKRLLCGIMTLWP